MKKLVLFLILPLFAIAQAEKPVVNDTQWLTDYETALEEAGNDDKNLLVYFTGSDWCPPCKKLKVDLFESAEFKVISGDYVLLYVDIPMNKDLISSELLEHNVAIAARLNKKNAVPLLKILDSKGKDLDEYSGYSMTGDIQYHLDLLERYQ